MLVERSLVEDYNFDKRGHGRKPIRLSFSDLRQLNKVDKNERRRQRLISRPDPADLCDYEGVDISHSETAKLVRHVEAELDRLQTELETYLSRAVVRYASPEDRRYLNETVLSQLRTERDRTLECLISLQHLLTPNKGEETTPNI